MADNAAPPDDFDLFYHFDSASTALDEGRLKIKVPDPGFYYVSLSNIFITWPNGVTAPVGTAFLSIEKFDSINHGSCITGDSKQSNKVLFPLDDPSVARPKSRVYNRILLSLQETIQFAYYDVAFTAAAPARIVATIHISSNPDIIRLTL